MNLKQLMYFKEKNGYTFEQLSELSGVPVGTIQKIFSGETRTPRHKTIQALEMIMKFEEKDEDSGYHSGDSHNDVVREAAPAYKARQGSYTLDDYFATPDNVRVELIDGVIYDMGMPSTVHQYLITKICHAIYSYIEEKGGHCMVFPASPGVQIDCDDRSMLVPDLVVVCDPAKLRRRNIMGAPDFVIEILSPSSVRRDTKIKLAKYAAAGVREYWVVDPDRERVCVYWTPEDDIAAVYGPQDDVPVGIFSGELKIPMREIFEQIRQMWSEEE